MKSGFKQYHMKSTQITPNFSVIPFTFSTTEQGWYM